MWKTGVCWSPVWILLLSKLIVTGAVVSDSWVCDTFSLTVSESHSLVEVWAMWKAGVCSSPVWNALLNKLVIAGAVIVNLWVWNTFSLTVSEGHSLIEVWAMRKTSVCFTPVWILLLSKLIVTGAVVSDSWVCDTFSHTVSESHSLVEIWAMWKAGVWLSPVWIFLFHLGKLIVTGAVVVNLWVWNTSSLTISKGESLIEIWAMRKACMWCTPVWIIRLSTELNLSLLTKLEIWVAV